MSLKPHDRISIVKNKDAIYFKAHNTVSKLNLVDENYFVVHYYNKLLIKYCVPTSWVGEMSNNFYPAQKEYLIVAINPSSWSSKYFNSP